MLSPDILSNISVYDASYAARLFHGSSGYLSESMFERHCHVRIHEYSPEDVWTALWAVRAAKSLWQARPSVSNGWRFALVSSSCSRLGTPETADEGGGDLPGVALDRIVSSVSPEIHSLLTVAHRSDEPRHIADDPDRDRRRR